MGEIDILMFKKNFFFVIIYNGRKTWHVKYVKMKKMTGKKPKSN
jgi:hypothetical protein